MCLYHRPPDIASSCPEPEDLRTYVISGSKSIPRVSGMSSAWKVTKLTRGSPRDTVIHLSFPSSLLSSTT